MAGLTMSQDKENSQYRRLVSHFLVASAALDPSNGPKAAAAQAARDSYAVTTDWMDQMLGKSRSEEQKSAAFEKFKAEVNACVELYGAHVTGANAQVRP